MVKVINAKTSAVESTLHLSPSNYKINVFMLCIKKQQQQHFFRLSKVFSFMGYYVLKHLKMLKYSNLNH